MAANRKALPPEIATEAFSITPHASNEVSPNRGFIVSVGGTVAFRAIDSTADVSITAVAGTFYPIAIKFLRATGTTATGIIGIN